MALPRIARGGNRVEGTLLDTRDRDLHNAAEDLADADREISSLSLEVATQTGRADRAEAAEIKARTALLETAADVAAMTERALPRLRPGMYADDPMPEDGKWAPVEGDAYELPALAGVSA